MNASTDFDLNAAIQRWRQNLGGSSQLRAENLDELEAHLRDAIAAMQGQRLTDEEIFLIATRRIGGVAQLEPEFAKVNAREVWLERALWMLVGLQVWGIPLGLATYVDAFLYRAGFLKSLNNVGIPSTGMFGLIHFGILIAIVWAGWRLVQREPKGTNAVISRILSNPRWLTLAVIVGIGIAFFFHVGGSYPRAYIWVNQSKQQFFAELWSSVAVWSIQAIALVVCTALLARRLLLRRPQTA